MKNWIKRVCYFNFKNHFCIKVDQFLSRHDQSAHSSNICMYFVKSSEILLTYLNALHQLSKVVS